MPEEAHPTCRGIRGAITVEGNEPAVLREATLTLLGAIVRANGCRTDDLAAAIFTVPDELSWSNPAAVAREAGWSAVPLLMVRESGGHAGVDRCLRVLLLWNTTRSQAAIRHVYLGGAAALRPDLSRTL
jgi:chorismate mutase